MRVGKDEWEGLWPLAAAAAALTALWLGPGCSADIFDVDVDLQQQAYTFDFGAPDGTIPMVPCDPAAPNVCASEVEARLPVEVDVTHDTGFTSAVEGRAISFVRVVDLAYTVPVNTLTFDVPQLDLYAGPPGTTRETDPGVGFIDHTAPTVAMTPVTEQRHFALGDASPARPLIESSIRDQKPFVLLLVGTLHLESGAPIPGGTLEVDVQPRITLGFPR